MIFYSKSLMTLALFRCVAPAIDCVRYDGFDPLRSYLGSELQEIEGAYANRNSSVRVYNLKEWNYDYRKKLILEYESKLL